MIVLIIRIVSYGGSYFERIIGSSQKNNSIRELNYFLSQYEADFYVFPEGFLDSHVLQEALDMIKKKEKYVITGFKDLKNNGQHKARAIENEIYVIGSSHFEGEIPLAYAFEPSGRCILLRQKEYGGFIVEIDLEKSTKKVINYCDDRVPGLFSRLAES